MTAVDLEPENWLTLPGDHRASVGLILGPGLNVGVCTVAVVDYDDQDDRGRKDGRGTSRLGCVSGDVRSELGMTLEEKADDDIERILTGLHRARLQAMGYAR